MIEIYVQKKEAFAYEAEKLAQEIRELLAIQTLEKLEIINVYSIDGVCKQDLQKVQEIVFCEPQVDEMLEELSLQDCDFFFGIAPLEGQFDKRSYSAIQCLQMLNLPPTTLKHHQVFKLYGTLTQAQQEAILSYLINPIESTEVFGKSHHTPQATDDVPQAPINLAAEDLKLIEQYLQHPNPLELKIIETYWSDHCRHTTFLTEISSIAFEDPLAEQIYQDYLQTRKELGRQKPISLMDLGTIMSAYLTSQGKAKSIAQTEEQNACTLEINVTTPKGDEKWYLFFKNETHNHPTEIEPFGGASTCIGGAIRDPLSARGYVYAGMRISGSANPLESISQTRKGKLPQRSIAIKSSDGFSSYGNQIGVATGMVEEIYHEGYKAKHLELGAVLGATPKEWVSSQAPQSGDVIVLLGGKTGRDGCGGASGSSLSHNIHSLSTCGSEVQKGNAPEERKIQRLFCNPNAIKLIKRCNDLGAGGISVALCELADGLEIHLDQISCKYEGMTAYDLTLSESQERMAILLNPNDVALFAKLAEEENLECRCIAKVIDEKVIIFYHHQQVVAKLPKALLTSNGAKRSTAVQITRPKESTKKQYNFIQDFQSLAQDLNICSKRGLIEKFDSTIGGNTIFMPLGGKYQSTPIQAMAHKIPFAQTTTCSVASFGFNPFLCEQNPLKGGYFAVIESVCRLIATGVKFEEIYLSFQEYFEKLGEDPVKWGKPFATLLGAFLAQKRLEICAIGGKDSMSGTFEELNVPPTFVSFAFAASDCTHLIAPEFKSHDSFVYLIKPELDTNHLPTNLKPHFDLIHSLIKEHKALSCYTPTFGGIAGAILKMCLGNRIGFAFEDVALEEIFDMSYGSFIIESKQKLPLLLLGKTTLAPHITHKQTSLSLDVLSELYEQPLQSVYPTQTQHASTPTTLPPAKHTPAPTPLQKYAKPRVLLPVFFGTNCEYDIQYAFEEAGAEVEILVLQNLTQEHIKQSIKNFSASLKRSQILFLSGGFSGADEPDGSAKMIKTFFFNPKIKESISHFLESQDSLIGGNCNGFQALVKLGLLPFGKILPSQADHPTLLHNTLLRHQSKIVRVKVCSNSSPWLSQMQIGEIYSLPISHGEGRFYAQDSVIEELARNGQIAMQYVDLEGNVSNDIRYNPNGSSYGIEALTSQDGRIFGKMGHPERYKPNLLKNIQGNFDMQIFKGAVHYFR
ncbi:phosphoribosylformylglycinamidine synthase [Helicobacter enhydrae]|uniref:Phosphoribosylformylglycinamidine synthase n=1 Tax=Helicobacter enhydrae TaxID=222136 RepID=A0A1B1U5L9_9HELI|nr:phosphoribosylformylglycinamidine synthase [Helicobacter enhydrae]ANV98048.1 phosphoribosylformylglycinamidine synthase [Helicobacter enhydrae]